MNVQLVPSTGASLPPPNPSFERTYADKPAPVAQLKRWASSMEPQGTSRICAKPRRALSSPNLRRRLRSEALLLSLGLGLGLQACSPESKLQVSYEEWQALGPGVPPADSSEQPSVGKVLRDGQGPVVALGDLVELHFRTRVVAGYGRPVGEHDDGRWWVWIGFDGHEKPDFPVGDNAFGAALIGLRQGSEQTFADM